MSKVLWSDRHRSEFEESLRLFGLFKRTASAREKALSEREMDPEQFLLRLRPQIFEMHEKCLPYLTPEEWDRSYYELDNKIRRSYSILKRMTWSQFVIQFDIISKSAN